MAEATDSLQPTLQLALGANYQIEHELYGRGMSRVFVGREVALNRRVVIKTLSPDFAAGISAERFRREIMLAASLQQANIVPVLAAGEMAGEGLPYYIMPFVEGESLRAHLAAKGRLSVREAAAILRDTARALAFAHSRGVVHRDIKPDNVLLSGSTAVVTDFGIAKAIEAAVGTPDAGALTQIGTALGTPMYMSPEQASGENIDARADIYALGVLGYELLTGVPPFVGPSARALLAAHVTQVPPDIAALRDDLPPALAALVMQCLEKDPERRPQTAQRVLDTLDSLSATDVRSGEERPTAGDGAGDNRASARKPAAATPALEPLALPLREPPRGAIWSSDVARQSGLEMLRSYVAGDLPPPPIFSLTGLRLTEVGFGSATAAMPSSAWLQSGAGVFLAGTIAFVADLALSAAALTSAPAGSLVSSSHLSVNYFRPATINSGGLVGRGRLIHSTRSLALSEVLVQDGRGRLLGHATSRCVLVRGERPAPPQAAAPAPSALPDPYRRPVEGDVLGQEVWDETPGLEIVRRVAANTLRPPVCLLFDWRGVEAREGEYTMSMPASAWLCNAFGTMYGGALAATADLAMTLAVGSTMPPASAYSPLDMTMHFLRAVLPDAAGGEIVARARVTHRGRTIAVVSCELTDAGGKLVAEASGSTLILPGRPWQRPVNVGDETKY